MEPLQLNENIDPGLVREKDGALGLYLDRHKAFGFAIVIRNAVEMPDSPMCLRGLLTVVEELLAPYDDQQVALAVYNGVKRLLDDLT